MRYIEVRRHSIRNDAGQITPAGIELARRVGHDIGPFNRVITSTIARTIDTATAMGFKVDAQDERLGIPRGTLGSQFGDEIGWARTFADFAWAIERGEAAAYIAQLQKDMWQAVAMSLPENGRGLLITHSGNTEAGAVACLPNADYKAWGPYCSYCEGVRLQFDGEKFTAIEILRVERQA